MNNHVKLWSILLFSISALCASEADVQREAWAQQALVFFGGQTSRKTTQEQLLQSYGRIYDIAHSDLARYQEYPHVFRDEITRETKTLQCDNLRTNLQSRWSKRRHDLRNFVTQELIGAPASADASEFGTYQQLYACLVAACSLSAAQLADLYQRLDRQRMSQPIQNDAHAVAAGHVQELLGAIVAPEVVLLEQPTAAYIQDARMTVASLLN